LVNIWIQTSSRLLKGNSANVLGAAGHAFLGTTNLDVASLTDRFQTRFQPVRLQPTENEVLAAFLARRWGAPITITRQIAEGAKGNVRAAMADLEMWMG